jgi:NitT/TauT family transport system substrate-binding protein
MLAGKERSGGIMRFGRLAAGFLLAVLAFASAARAEEPYHLRIGWVVAPADLSTLMFLRPDLAPHAGKTYIPELTHFAGTPAEMQAIATGDLDTAALAFSTFALGIVNAGMDDLRVLGDEFQDGVPGYHTNPFMVRNDSGIETVDDLNGKVLATNQVGSAVDMAMRAMLAKHHLQDRRDVTIIEVRFPDMKAMLSGKKVDLVSAPAPFGFDPELTQFARTLFTQEEAMGRSQMIVRVARAGFIDKHRQAMVDFLSDYLHALRYMLDPAHHDEAVKLATEATKQSADKYQSWFYTKQDYYRDPDGRPNLEALQKNIDLQRQLGFLRKQIDVSKYTDPSLMKEAAAALAKEGPPR